MSERLPMTVTRLARSAGVTASLVAITLASTPAAMGATAEPSNQAPEAAATAGPESTQPASTERPACRRLTDFTAEDTGTWFVVNDGVMGGRSDGGGFIDESVLRFEGTVVTAGGGFTSARLRLEGDELADSARIEMRVRPDGRTYGLTLEDAAEFRGRLVSHRADLDIGPVDSEGWALATVSYDQLVPSLFGVLVDAPPFDPATAREFGLIIADGIDGDFVLDIDWIDACP
jgi:hypothetical protein